MRNQYKILQEAYEKINESYIAPDYKQPKPGPKISGTPDYKQPKPGPKMPDIKAPPVMEVVTPANEEDVDSKELEMGIKTEMEHTDNKAEAKKIALQHLAEDPHYYSKLKKIEKK